MIQYPIIFWIHSPIGYETYLAFKSTNTSTPTYAISARNLFIKNSLADIGLPGLYQFETPEDKKSNIGKIKDAIMNIASEHSGFVIIVPQTAQPYIKLLIESDYCKGYAIYDEGDAAYGNSWTSYTQPSFHKYEIEKTNEWLSASKELKFNLDKIIANHKFGVPFYDLIHEKFMGLFSFFEEAFPGAAKIKLQIPNDIVKFNNITKQYSLILCGDLTNIENKDETAKNHLSNINNLINACGNKKWIFKAHPNDRSHLLIKKIDSEIQTWESFCAEYNIDSSRESAFMNFNLYVSQKNSTIQFLKILGKSNFITIE